MMQDRADRLSDEVEEKTLAKCAELYNEALLRCVRRFRHVFRQLEELDEKKPPTSCDTPEKQEKWRERQRRRILDGSGMSKGIARELAAAGAFSADVIRESMSDIDRINRVVDDIG